MEPNNQDQLMQKRDNFKVKIRGDFIMKQKHVKRQKILEGDYQIQGKNWRDIINFDGILQSYEEKITLYQQENKIKELIEIIEQIKNLISLYPHDQNLLKKISQHGLPLLIMQYLNEKTKNSNQELFLQSIWFMSNFITINKVEDHVSFNEDFFLFICEQLGLEQNCKILETIFVMIGNLMQESLKYSFKFLETYCLIDRLYNCFYRKDLQQTIDFGIDFSWLICNILSQNPTQLSTVQVEKLLNIIDNMLNFYNQEIYQNIVRGLLKFLDKNVRFLGKVLSRQILSKIIQKYQKFDQILEKIFLKLLNIITSTEDENIKILIRLGLLDIFSLYSLSSQRDILIETSFGISNLMCCADEEILNQLFSHVVYQNVLNQFQKQVNPLILANYYYGYNAHLGMYLQNSLQIDQFIQKLAAILPRSICEVSIQILCEEELKSEKTIVLEFLTNLLKLGDIYKQEKGNNVFFHRLNSLNFCYALQLNQYSNDEMVYKQVEFIIDKYYGENE